ncbi:MAG: DUF4360 domain-containing protein [Dactylosporangium sp.]|nr:DUF4360 domain-containing protein [Dactylosporangium sp.]NNJ61447.1 DUF4360 domain-containing protein [Dactylosporangium sp.]
MLNVVAVGSMVASLLAPTSALASTPTAEIMAPSEINVEVVTVNGSGCPSGQGTVIMSPDRASFRVFSPAYIAWVGGPASPTDFRQNCQLNLHVSRPQGLTYAVARIDSSGFAHLASGASGVSRLSLYFQGVSQTTTLTHTFAGPMTAPWSTTDTIGPDELNYAPCDADRNLNVNTQLRVIRGTSDPDVASLMVRDQITDFRLTWKSCPST